MEKWYSSVNNLFNRSATKQCMAGRFRNKAIKAHSISEARVLRKISENGQAITIVPGESMDGVATLGIRGIGQISTFSGFCAKHDQKLFEPIDTQGYAPGDKKQEFFFAYRTLAQSFWYTLANARMNEAYSKALDKAAPASIYKTAELEALRTKTRDKMEKFAQESCAVAGFKRRPAY